MEDRSSLLKQIMTYDFAVHELTLFLDTHPKDKQALEMHKALSEKAMKLTDEYQEKFGPLTAQANMSADEWKWLKSPWPWEN